MNFYFTTSNDMQWSSLVAMGSLQLLEYWELSGFCGATESQTRLSALLASGATSPHRDTSLPQASQPHLIHLYWRWTKRCLGNLSLKISGVWPPWSIWLWHFLWFLRGLPSCLWFQYHTSIIWYRRLKPKPRELVSILDLDVTRIYSDIIE